MALTQGDKNDRPEPQKTVTPKQLHETHDVTAVHSGRSVRHDNRSTRDRDDPYHLGLQQAGRPAGQPAGWPVRLASQLTVGRPAGLLVSRHASRPGDRQAGRPKARSNA